MFLAPAEGKLASMVHGPWCIVHGPWSMVHGPWSMVHSPWGIVHGPWSMVHGPLSIVHGKSALLQRTKRKPMFLVQTRGPWSMVQGHNPWDMVHGPWCIVHGPWSMVHGPSSMENQPCCKGRKEAYVSCSGKQQKKACGLQSGLRPEENFFFFKKKIFCGVPQSFFNEIPLVFTMYSQFIT